MTLSRLSTLLLAVCLAAPLALAQPINDTFLFSTPMTAAPQTYTGTNVDATAGATQNPIASCTTSDGNNSAWWYFHATAAGTVTIDLDGSTFDTIVTVLDGDLAEVACNDDDPANTGSDFTSLVEATVAANTSYFVRVTGWGGTGVREGDIAMSVTGAPITGPAGDSEDNALEMQASATHWETNVGATAEDGGDPISSCEGATNESSIWRTFVAPAAGAYDIHTISTPFDTVLDVWADGDTSVPSTYCDDDSGSDLTSLVTITATSAGQEFAVRVRGFGGAEGLIFLTSSPSTATAEEAGPERFTLSAPFPNPAGGLVHLGATLAEAGAVRAEVFDALGRRVAVVADGEVAAGDVAWTWDAAGQPAGVYVVRMSTEDEVRTQTVTVVR